MRVDGQYRTGRGTNDTLSDAAHQEVLNSSAHVVERAMIASSGDTLQLDEPLRGEAVAPVLENLDAVMHLHIQTVLQKCGWRINGSGNAAERLGIHPNTLRYRMKKLGVVGPAERAQQSTPPTRLLSACRYINPEESATTTNAIPFMAKESTVGRRP